MLTSAVSRYIVHVLHRFSLQSARSRCHVKRQLSLSIRPSYGARGEEILDGGETPDTQANDNLAVLAFGFSPFRERNNFIRLS